MTTWENTNICRICSSPADYELFAKIPTYLHANTNEFLSWQKPINLLLEEVTGLKITTDDGLPRKICALCISYLKHAVSFREQTINNALSLRTVELLRQITQNQQKTQLDTQVRQMSEDDKASLLITAQELNYTDTRQVDTNLLVNNCQQEPDKVCKKLLNNSFQTNNAPTQQNIEQQMRYLNLLFDKDTNAGLKSKYRNAAGTNYDLSIGSGGEVYAEDEFQTATSSDDNGTGALVAGSAGGVGVVGATKQKHNIFTYKEKNFEEDDIMDVEELRDAITINIPESCKERKCRACFRRFMFEDSYKEHMNSCIEYRFLTFIEEINRLLDIRRNKGISPHEFIRRMIFCLRKTCEWLKANCGDMLLPDLLHNAEGAIGSKQPIESEGAKSSSSVEQGQLRKEKTACKNNLLYDENQRKNVIKRTTDFLLRNTKLIDENLLLQTLAARNAENVNGHSNVMQTTPLKCRTPSTPITISNNILYEIERSQSRNSVRLLQDQPLLPANLNNSSATVTTSPNVMKPIAVLATNVTTTTTRTATVNCNLLNNDRNTHDDVERLTFLQKLQQAACQTPPAIAKRQQQDCTTPSTPFIEVRKDLFNEMTSKKLQTPPPLTPVTPTTPAALMSSPIMSANLNFSARCNPCNKVFETLASLELHNAKLHNNITQHKNAISNIAAKPVGTDYTDAERKRIIALFEEDESQDEN